MIGIRINRLLSATFLVLMFLSPAVQAQEVILDKNVSKEMFDTKEGPNTKRFSHAFFSVSTFVKSLPGQADVKYPGSLMYSLGYRTKYKITEWYALGYEIEYRLSNFRYASLHDSLPAHKKDKLIYHALALDFFQRFNLDKRGNYIGKFIDIGAYGEFLFVKNNVLIDENSYLSSTDQKLILSGLKYMNNFNYGVSARIGYNRVVLFALYRLSGIFKSDYGRQDLPRLNVGLQFGIHR